ncbi:MAG: hypothetical protein M0Z35_17610 [Desulfitobacterium hafniense]|nr:hypothetical protein [Desulfitobacterium hafniense]
MTTDKDKTYRPHIKVYPRDEKEESNIREHARKKGFSASALLRVLALKDMKKGDKI